MTSDPRSTIHDPRFLTFAHQLADAAGDVIRPYFGAHGEVAAKADTSPVTLADRAAEAAMRRLIEQHYPDHAIYGEEEGQKKTISEYTWVLDPIDGTRAFIAGRKEWGTLIALCADGVPVLGILDQPVTGERWVGVKGKATLYYRHSNESWNPSSQKQVDPSFRWNDGVSIKTRACASLAEAELSTTSANYFTPEQASRVVKLAQACRSTVKDGDCYAYGLLARGLRDVVVDAGLKPYDILALVPIIEGAGGKITGWDGEKITLQHYASTVAMGDPALSSELCLARDT